MVQAYLGLGSNIGDRKQQLLKAIDLIETLRYKGDKTIIDI